MNSPHDRHHTPLALGTALTGCASHPPAPDLEAARQEVAATERAFAATMAARDFEAFADFLADDSIFLADTGPLRGKQQVVEHWRRYYTTPEAPFSWEPETVEVLASGDLALSTGPVRTPDGRLIAVFTSFWRREADGAWRIVFDRGCPAVE